MVSNPCLYLAILFLLVGFTSSSYISYDVLKAGKSTGRSLLQAVKACPINLEAQNYTVITSKCKGPNYPAAVCCEALLEFVCVFVDEINDPNNNCADIMFSYINLYGNYPPGLFANQCKDGKDGLSCDKVLNAQEIQQKKLHKSSSSSSSASANLSSFAFLLILACFLF